jgi:hypothetical protein
MKEKSSEKAAHLELIMGLYQNIDNNSQSVKQWSISLASVFLAMSTQEKGTMTSILAFFPITLLWMLDARCQYREKLILAHYNYVRSLPDSEIDFCLDYEKHNQNVGHWLVCMADRSVLGFNLTMIGGILLVDWFVK